jgi:hypothetical protein
MSIKDLEHLAAKMSAGGVSIGDWEVLIHFARDKGLVVELGTNIGSTAMILSRVAQYVVTVDVFESLHLIENPEFREKYRNHFEVNQHYFSTISNKLSIFDNIRVFQGLSFNFAEKYPSEVVDLVFVDADHSYEGVKRDYQAWFDKIKIGGHFAFHDVGEGCPVLDFYNNELLHDDRIALEEFEAVGPCWTKVFRRIK